MSIYFQWEDLFDCDKIIRKIYLNSHKKTGEEEFDGESIFNSLSDNKNNAINTVFSS